VPVDRHLQTGFRASPIRISVLVGKSRPVLAKLESAVRSLIDMMVAFVDDEERCCLNSQP